MLGLSYAFNSEKNYEIIALKKRDLDECCKIVSKQNKDKNLKQKMNFYINNETAVAVKDKGRIIALAFWFIGENGVSLTHFYVDEFYRKKPFMLWFYTQICAKFGGRKAYIHSKNVWEYKNMLKPTDVSDEYELMSIGELLHG